MNQDEVREEFLRFYHQKHNDLGIPIQVGTKLVADWWLSKFDTILAKKREEIEKMDVSESFAEEVKAKVLSILTNYK